MSKRTFVKAESTTVAASKSRNEIETMLKRYGAVGYSFAYNAETGEANVSFIVPDSPAKGAERIPVRIPVNTFDVYDALYGVPMAWSVKEQRNAPRPRPYTHDARRVEQAERVAWRNLVLWIDAALSAATIGLRTIAQTFAGDRLVTEEDGRVSRVADIIARGGGALPGGSRVLMLPSTT
jgi:hypothetical protein